MEFFLSTALAEGETADVAAEVQPTWFQTAFEEFGEKNIWFWLVLAILLIGGLIAWRMSKGGKKTVWTTKMLSLGAICMALSSVLSLVKLWHMPMGGSITPASMLPLMLFAYVYGVGPGCILGALYGVMQFLLDGYGLGFGVVAMLLDYPIGFAMMGLAGMFRHVENERGGLIAGVVLGSFGRFLASFISGWVFYGIYAADYGFASPVLYSICYNGAYMLPDCIICVILAVLMGNRLIREARKVK